MVRIRRLLDMHHIDLCSVIFLDKLIAFKLGKQHDMLMADERKFPYKGELFRPRSNHSTNRSIKIYAVGKKHRLDINSMRTMTASDVSASAESTLKAGLQPLRLDSEIQVVSS